MKDDRVSKDSGGRWKEQQGVRQRELSFLMDILFINKSGVFANVGPGIP